MNEEAVKEIDRQAAEEKWPYPRIFDALKNSGVERYETNVLTHEIKYVGGGTSFTQPAPDGFQPLSVGPAFDEPALKKALGRVQRGETTYAQFLGEIAAAGVPYYRVDMKPRTVTYHGQKRANKLVEKVPTRY